jgi:glycerol-3-phosphate dehydrogenase
VLFAFADSRLFFVIPWQNYSLIGTTDTDYTGDLDNVEAEAKDVTYLLKEVQSIFPNVRSGDIFYTSAGLRALARSKSRRPEDVSRSHKLVDHEREDGIGGFVSVLGGKITAYRAVAEQTVDLVCHKLAAKTPCTTAEVPLPGAPIVPQQSLQQAANERGLALDTVAHLASLYGSRFSQVLDILNRNPKGAQRLCPHCQDIVAQVQHAVEQEGALTIEDFLLRRSAIGLSPCQGLDALNSVASEMGRLLGWSYTEQQRQEDAYRAQAALGQRFRNAGLA